MKEDLFSKSQGFGQKSLDAYLADDHAAFVLHAGVAIELLGKTLLANIHPALIVEPRDVDSLFQVCEAPGFSKRPLAALKTIGAHETIERCAKLYPRLNAIKKDLGSLFEQRNAVVHLGTSMERGHDDLLVTYLKASRLVLEALGCNEADYFSGHSWFVEQRLDKTTASIIHRIGERIARARVNYQRRFDSIGDPAIFAALRDLLTRSYKLRTYDDTLTPCPACGSDALLSGSAKGEWEFDGEDSSLHVDLYAHYFFCAACNLELDGADEIEAAGLDSKLAIEEFDKADFVDHWDEDVWRDR